MSDSGRPIVDETAALSRLERQVGELERQVGELERETARQRLLLSSVHEAMIVTDGDGRVTDWNSAAETLFGWQAAEMLGRPFAERFPPPIRHGVTDILQTVRDGSAYAGEWEDFRKDGTRVWVDTRMQRVLDSAGVVRALVSVSRDITERKREAKERQEIEARLEYARRLESLGALAGGVAHDFNNLLTSVLGNTDLALAHLPPSSPVRSHLKHIEYAARRAAELTRQMLACSGRGQFQVRPLGLGDVLRGKLPWIRAAFPAHVTLDLAIADALPYIDGDAEQIGQVLMHVLTNACEALGGSPGTVRIVSDVAHCTRADLASPYVDEQLPEGRYVFIDVTDTGCGMTPDTLARMFEPFFTTKFTGRGLGLAATLGILRGHRGAVHVTSTVGRGTTIRLWFPAHAPQEVAPFASVAAPGAGSGTGVGPSGPRGVLVIDDEETVRGVAKTILERAGFPVITAASGIEGIARFRDSARDIALVLLDLRLPAMSSRQVYDELTRLQPAIRIVLSSGYLEEEALSSFEPNQIAGFLPKPYRFDELISCVQRVVGGDIA